MSQANGLELSQRIRIWSAPTIGKISGGGAMVKSARFSGAPPLALVASTPSLAATGRTPHWTASA
jgi:hypothetical protein